MLRTVAARRPIFALGWSPFNRHLFGLAITILLVGLATGGAHAAEVDLTRDNLLASGVTTAPLQVTTFRTQVEGVATAIDPQSLAVVAAQLATARAAVESAREEVKSTEAQAKRLQALYGHGNFVSESDEQVAVAAAAAARAQKVSAVATEASARANAIASWGPALEAIAQQGPDAFADYADQRRAVLDVALPIGTTAAPAAGIKVVLPSGEQRTASLIGPAPRADAVVQGPTYFYSTSGNGLRSGQRFAAEVPVGATQASGVVMPKAAVLWYAGEPWVYIEVTPGHFWRRLISTDEQDTTGWFQAKGFKAGERVVVQGAELLLSQELKPPPDEAPAGDDDDD